ncbi:MAG: ParB/RepB/Spo0J family partition protein [Candidatus Dormibacteraceae bacterium]
MTPAPLPEGLALVAVENIHPGPLQPRTTISIELIHQLADSMRAGRHQPLLEVERSPLRPGQYQIVCGEQRWRAAKEAGVGLVLVRVLNGLNHLTRLRKQYEENRLRADLTPADDAYLVLSMKSLKDIEVAERLLTESLVAFQLLTDKRVKDRSELEEHLASLKKLLLEHNVHVIKSDTGQAVAPLSPWRDTERTLGISEAARKRKLAVLRLEPDVLAEANALPAQHVPLIAQVDGRERRAALVERAPYLTNRQLQAAVRRLRGDREMSVDDAVAGRLPVKRPDPLAFEVQLENLCDLCRQIARLLNNIGSRVSSHEKQQLLTVVGELRATFDTFEEAA